MHNYGIICHMSESPEKKVNTETETPETQGLDQDKFADLFDSLDEETLRAVAKAGNGAYIHAGGEEFGLNPIIQDIRRMEDEEFGSVVFEEYDEQYMYFFGIALLLLVIEMLIGERKPRRKLFEV